jgi:NCAIR mutase (PurE)-related protein
MTLSDDFLEDKDRRNRTGLDESIFCEAKTSEQITRIVERIYGEERRALLTRLTPDQYSQLPVGIRGVIAYDPLSRTGMVGRPVEQNLSLLVAIVSGGTSDAPVVAEAVKTLEYYGYVATLFQDIGVAGLWRVLESAPALQNFPVIIAVAGMDAALPTVLAGLVPSAVIAVPTSIGYGVTAGGSAALNSLLSSCVPGITVVNIDNGFGAACAAVRILNFRD